MVQFDTIFSRFLKIFYNLNKVKSHNNKVYISYNTNKSAEYFTWN